jgi:hypothetical protein
MRNLSLSHLIMEGLEMTLLANDASGAPIPYSLFNPASLFNGKIFNFILHQISTGHGLPEIVGYKMELIFNMEQIKSVLVQGGNGLFAQDPGTTGGNGRRGKNYFSLW